MTKPRQEFPAKVCVEAFKRADGECESCTRKLFPGDIRYDHRIPDFMGGEPILSNCQVLCRGCHEIKTSTLDVPAIAKVKRIEAAHLGVKRASPRPIPGSRASGRRKRMNGNVEAW